MVDVKEFTKWAEERMQKAIDYLTPYEDQLGGKTAKWHARRSVTIGGSDIGTWIGTNPFQTPLQLFNTKTLRTLPWGGNFITDLGTFTEPLIIKYAAKKLLAEDIGGKMIYDHKAPWRTAQLDSTLKVPHFGNQIIHLECKSSWGGAEWGPGSTIDANGGIIEPCYEIPTSYYCQVMHGLDIEIRNKPDAPRMAILAAWLRMENEVRIYVVEYDEDLALSLRDEADKFIECLMSDQTPPLVDADIIDKFKKYRTREGDNFISNKAPELAKKYNDLKGRIYELETAQAEIADQMKALIGEHEGLVFDEKVYATYKYNVQNRLDSKLLKEEQPEIYKQYCRPSESRRFSVKSF